MGLIICGGIWATLLRRSAPAVEDKTPPSTLSSNHPSRG
jgi:hypothetical protein